MTKQTKEGEAKLAEHGGVFVRPIGVNLSVSRVRSERSEAKQEERRTFDFDISHNSFTLVMAPQDPRISDKEAYA